ncbi:MAG: tetratricopeptide repeat protein [Oscillospiraceae bacterium]|nr:tetratricopeptide repeat protein [Oscillospiraceae bacterium]
MINTENAPVTAAKEERKEDEKLEDEKLFEKKKWVQIATFIVPIATLAVSILALFTFVPRAKKISEDQLLAQLANNVLRGEKVYAFVVPEQFRYAYIPSLGDYGAVYYPGDLMKTNEAVFIEENGNNLIGVSGLSAGLIKLENSDLYYKMGLDYWEDYNFKEAEKYLIEARERIGDIRSQTHPDVARVNSSLGVLYTEMCKFEEAHGLLLRTIHAFDSASSEGMIARLNMAALLREQGEFKYKNAMTYLMENLKNIEENGDLSVEYELHIATYLDIGLMKGDLSETKEDFAEALEYCNKALEISILAFGEEHHNTGVCYNGFATLYYDMGDYEKAKKYVDMAYPIDETKEADLATSYNNEAIMLSSMGKNNAALEKCKEAIRIRERLYGVKHYLTGMAYRTMGGIYADLSDYKSALDFTYKARDIIVETFQEEHKTTALIYNSLGHTYSGIGKYEDALKYSEKELEIKIILFGREHPQTASAYNGQAYILKAWGRHKDALELFEKSAEISYRLDPEHPDSIIARNNIASVYNDLERYPESETLCLETLKLIEKRLGKEHWQYVATLNNLGQVYQEMASFEPAVGAYEPGTGTIYLTPSGQVYQPEEPEPEEPEPEEERDYLQLSLKYFNEALRLGLENLPENHTLIKTVYYNLARLYVDMDDFDQAISYGKKCVEISEKIFESDSIELTWSYINQSQILLSVDDSDGSLSYAQKAVDIFDAANLDDFVGAAYAYHALANVYMNNSQLDDAEFYYYKAYNIFCALYGENDSRALRVRRDLVMIGAIHEGRSGIITLNGHALYF